MCELCERRVNEVNRAARTAPQGLRSGEARDAQRGGPIRRDGMGPGPESEQNAERTRSTGPKGTCEESERRVTEGNRGRARPKGAAQPEAYGPPSAST